MSEFGRARATLERFRNPDGGFGLHPGHPSEPEPSAMAAIALDDDDARGWLLGHQRADGSFGLVDGAFADDASTPFAALALPDGAAREAALDHVEATHGVETPFFPEIPIDPTIPGWGWNAGTASWVEPTARALWALRLLRPTSQRIEDAVALLRDREAEGGGWNHGNPEVLGTAIPPNPLPTAITLIAINGIDADLESRGRDAFLREWRSDTPGPLTIAAGIVALGRHDVSGDVEELRSALLELVREPILDYDGVAWSWIALTEDGGRVVFP